MMSATTRPEREPGMNIFEHTDTLLVESSLPSGRAKAYHGTRFIEDTDGFRFSLNHIGTGEGLAALGPGIYLGDSIELARLYAEQNQRRGLGSMIVECTNDYSKLYDPIMGEPAELAARVREAVRQIEDELGREPRVNRLKQGPYMTGALFAHHGNRDAWRMLRDMGVNGIYEKLPSWGFEVCMYDAGAIRIDAFVEATTPSRDTERKMPWMR